MGAGLGTAGTAICDRRSVAGYCAARFWVVALAYAGVRLVQVTNAGGIPRADEIVMDLRVLVLRWGRVWLREQFWIGSLGAVTGQAEFPVH